MFEFNFDGLDIDATIRANVPTYQRKLVAEVLLPENFSEAAVDALGMRLLGDVHVATFILPTGAPGPIGAAQGGMYAYLKAEAYELFCTNSKAYAPERKNGTVTVNNLVGILATTAGSTFGVSAAVFSGVASLIVMLILKMGVNAYCKANTPVKNSRAPTSK